MRKRKRPLHHRLRSFFIPHKTNGYKPHVLRTASVTALIAFVLVLEGAYFGVTKIVFPHTDFLASVLPGSLIALTNGDREANGVPAVSEDQTLDQAALDAAQDMAAKGYFAHVSPDGKDPWYWLNLVGYDYEYAGENLAVNFTDSSDVETAWMNSPTHRANIVKPQYTKVGIGVANGTYEGKDATFVVQFFATPPAAGSAPAADLAGAAPSKPVQTATPSVSGEGDILGTEAAAAPVAPAPPSVAPVTPIQVTSPAPAAPAVVDQAATSPTHTLQYFLYGLAGIVLVLLLAAVFIQMNMQYLEVLAGGFALLIVLIGFASFDGYLSGKVQLPTDNQAAAVERAF